MLGVAYVEKKRSQTVQEAQSLLDHILKIESDADASINAAGNNQRVEKQTANCDFYLRVVV